VEFALLAIVIVAALAGLVGWVLVLIEAFRFHPFWGAASTILPPVGLVFIVLHWRRCRVGALVVLVSGGALAAAGGAMLASKPEKRGGISGRSTSVEPARPAPTPEVPPDEFAPPPTPTALPFAAPIVAGAPPDTPTPKPTAVPTLPYRAARNHEDQYLEIHLRTGKQVRVRLLQYSDESLKVLEIVGGGSIRYEIPRDNVEGFRIIR
jgi:hypothetical protein